MKRLLMSAAALGLLASAAQAQNVTTLHVINCGADGDLPVQNEHIAAWEAENPAYKVNLEYVPWGQCEEKAISLARAGDAPASAYMGSRTLKMLADNDLIQTVELTDEEKAGYAPSVLATVQFDGKVWGLPRAFSTKGLFWNKTLFAEAGLPTDKGPQTWAEVLTAAKAIDEKTSADGIGIPAASFDNTMHQFLKWMYSNGGQVVDAEGEVVFNSPQNVETMEFYKELAQYAEPGPLAYDRGKLEPLFNEGRIGMVVHGGFGRKGFSNVDYGIELIPAGPHGAQSTLLITDSLVIFKGTGVEEPALSLVKYLTAPERQFEVDKQGGWTPVRLVEGAEETLLAEDPNWKVFLDGIAIGGPEPVMTDYRAMQDILIEAIQGVVMGEVEPAAAVAEAQARLEEIAD
ncbi:sugar ABC transporter substrate-binding protein [Neomegalonema sp.]|uniref:ABC transporter substrate-binding protein n=1 Tax=Neomegalonema sp. TaxID=2039713 RepID=UPI00261124F7|nr:sugar ABC transporter substrate-binding protein [Neomegalonema sp.]MDD2869189.1 sugar ABC transporter substrate-binding protein [Neomegalonema sp.]